MSSGDRAIRRPAATGRYATRTRTRSTTSRATNSATANRPRAAAARRALARMWPASRRHAAAQRRGQSTSADAHRCERPRRQRSATWRLYFDRDTRAWRWRGCLCGARPARARRAGWLRPENAAAERRQPVVFAPRVVVGAPASRRASATSSSASSPARAVYSVPVPIGRRRGCGPRCRG